MTTTSTEAVKVVKTYRGKGTGRVTVWAVRRYVTAEIFETLGVWATEAEALTYTTRNAA